MRDPISNADAAAMPAIAELSPESCVERQAILLERLAARGLTAALIVDRRHVHYLTGFWARSVFAPALLLGRGLEPTLAVPYAASSEAARVVTYEASHFGTLIDDGLAAAVDVLLGMISPASTIGSDLPIAARRTDSIAGDLLQMRRRKWPDELRLLRRGIAAAEAAYAHAARIVAPGLSEMDLYAELLKVITLVVGEPVGELGNDFQAGSPGGPSRQRGMVAGELLPLDLGVCVRGYTADMCRTFAVGRKPSARQAAAHARVIEVLEEIEPLCGPGVSCRQLYERSRVALCGFEGCSFEHHLGHGVGIAPHEAPRINPHWDDTLAEGDVFTLEPGLYHPELRAGVRVEQMYYVTTAGVECLSQVSKKLVP